MEFASFTASSGGGFDRQATDWRRSRDSLGPQLAAQRRRGMRFVELRESGIDDAAGLRLIRHWADASEVDDFVSFGEQDADTARLYLKDSPGSLIIEDGEARILPARRARHTCVRSLRPTLHWRPNHSLDLLSFILPGAALERWAADAGVRAFDGLRKSNEDHRADEVITGFGLALLPLLDCPEEAPRLFVDHALHAMCGYLARTFGTHQKPAQHRGGLAPWQVRRATEMIAANLDAAVSLQDLANECRLSISHFTKAFRESLGQSPHQWLLERRVDQAKGRLLTSDLPLSEIATACGFADQSHFSRAFTKRVGTSPGAWRLASRAKRRNYEPIAVR